MSDPTPIPEELIKTIPPLSLKEEETSLRRLDERSVAEFNQLGSGLPADEIKKRAEAAEADRTERFRDHYEDLAIVTLYFAWGVLMILGAVWVYHLIAPETWWHLPELQVKQLHGIVTGGILVGLAGGHVKKRLQ